MAGREVDAANLLEATRTPFRSNNPQASRIIQKLPLKTGWFAQYPMILAHSAASFAMRGTL